MMFSRQDKSIAQRRKAQPKGAKELKGAKKLKGLLALPLLFAPSRFAFAPWRETSLSLLIALILTGALCLPAHSRAQGAASNAAIWYEEAAAYARKKYEQYEREGLGFDQKLVEETEREQRALAARYAAQVAAREALSATEIFYLGQLYNSR
jgi:hypothetical protein